MILVIGYGNTLCGDDGVGPYMVEWLASEESREDVECLAVYQLMPELAEQISRADVVIFVDAAQGGAPGQIICDKLAPLHGPSTLGAFTHHAKAETLLVNASSLYGQSPEAYLYTLTGQDFNIGDSFSPVVQQTLPLLFDQLKARIAQCMNLASLKQ